MPTRLLVATRLPHVVGGIETYLAALIPRLRELGFEVALVTSIATDQPPFAADALAHCWHFGETTESRAAAMKQIHRWNPAVVYLHGMAAVEQELELARTFPCVYFSHNYAGMCISMTKCHQVPVWQPCDRSLGPACLALYLPRRCGGLNPFTALRLYREERHRQKLFAECRAVLVASRHMETTALQNGVPADRLKLTPLFAPGMTPDIDPPPPRSRTDRVLYLGRLSNLKGWRILLEAVPRASSMLGRTLTLAIAGDGSESGMVAEAAKQNPQIEWLGWIDRERREVEMRRADILAVPSVWPEPFGLVGIEAGAVGLPSVAFATGGITDWLVSGVSGELAAGTYPDLDGFTAAIIRAIRDDKHRQRLSHGAWEASRKFTVEAHLERLLPILQRAITS